MAHGQPRKESVEEQGIGGRIGRINLAAGVRVSHFWTYMYASLICIGMMSNMNFSQPYILLEHLGIISADEAGDISGGLTGITEIVCLLLIWPFGMLADRIGRRPVIMLGIGMIGLTYALYPWATEVSHLQYFRVFYGIGVAAAASMTATIQNDYPVESSRGRVVGFSSAFKRFRHYFRHLAGLIPAHLAARFRDGSGGRRPVRIQRRSAVVLRVDAYIPLRAEGWRAGNGAAATALGPVGKGGHRPGAESTHPAGLPVRGDVTRRHRRGRHVHVALGQHRGQNRRRRRSRSTIPGMAAVRRDAGIRGRVVVRIRDDS